jgi:DNA (cytosine-5)-methyltransferase 1
VLPYVCGGNRRTVLPDFSGVGTYFFGNAEHLTGEQVLEACGLSEGQLDLVVGGPPCQGYSHSGKRNVADPRNNCTFDFARLCVEMRPKTLCMENVPGILSMTLPDGRPVVDEFCRILERGDFGEYDALKRMFSDDPSRRLTRRSQKQPAPPETDQMGLFGGDE